MIAIKQSSKLNRYTNIQALERLLLLIVTLIKHPRVGCPDELDKADDKHHNALELVQIQLKAIALSLRINLPEQYPATATLKKDLELLRDYQILDRRMYRWGYYLGRG